MVYPRPYIITQFRGRGFSRNLFTRNIKTLIARERRPAHFRMRSCLEDGAACQDESLSRNRPTPTFSTRMSLPTLRLWGNANIPRRRNGRSRCISPEFKKAHSVLILCDYPAVHYHSVKGPAEALFFLPRCLGQVEYHGEKSHIISV